jgi:threonine aldolase
MNFGSDNVYGVHPMILGAINEANAPVTAAAYGHDEGSSRVERELSRVFERDVKAFLVLNGTAANSLALSAMVPPYGGVVCHAGAHINTDECGAPELFTGGAKLILAGGEGSKLTPSAIDTASFRKLFLYPTRLSWAQFIPQTTSLRLQFWRARKA